MSEQTNEAAERAHHPDCPVNYFTDIPQRCRCMFMAILDRPRRTTPLTAETTAGQGGAS